MSGGRATRRVKPQRIIHAFSSSGPRRYGPDAIARRFSHREIVRVRRTRREEQRSEGSQRFILDTRSNETRRHLPKEKKKSSGPSPAARRTHAQTPPQTTQRQHEYSRNSRAPRTVARLRHIVDHPTLQKRKFAAHDGAAQHPCARAPTSSLATRYAAHFTTMLPPEGGASKWGQGT